MKRFLTNSLLLSLLAAGCDRGAGPSAPNQALKPGTGVIEGAVQFVGTPPVMATLPNKPCHANAPPLKDEAAVVADDGGLANVFVFLKDVSADDNGGADPNPPPALDQKECRYVPHAVAVRAGRPLVIRTEDDTVHNVHYDPANNAANNFSLSHAGQSKTVTFRSPDFVRVTCDVHPWMCAWVGVFDHPWFAVTDAAGHFEIKNLPAGTYTLAAWQERLGEVDQPVTITPGGPANVRFEFKPPG